MIGSWSNFSKVSPKIWGPLTANISGMEHDINNLKMALQSVIFPAYDDIIWQTLVHKWRKIGPELAFS